MFVEPPEIAGIEAAARRLEAQVAEASGVINAAHGVLVQAVIEVIADPRQPRGGCVHPPVRVPPEEGRDLQAPCRAATVTGSSGPAGQSGHSGQSGHISP